MHGLWGHKWRTMSICSSGSITFSQMAHLIQAWTIFLGHYTPNTTSMLRAGCMHSPSSWLRPAESSNHRWRQFTNRNCTKSKPIWGYFRAMAYMLTWFVDQAALWKEVHTLAMAPFCHWPLECSTQKHNSSKTLWNCWQTQLCSILLTDSVRFIEVLLSIWSIRMPIGEAPSGSTWTIWPCEVWNSTTVSRLGMSTTHYVSSWQTRCVANGKGKNTFSRTISRELGAFHTPSMAGRPWLPTSSTNIIDIVVILWQIRASGRPENNWRSWSADSGSSSRNWPYSIHSAPNPYHSTMPLLLSSSVASTKNNRTFCGPSWIKIKMTVSATERCSLHSDWWRMLRLTYHSP